ncbi:MAG: peptide-methionine (S)-S-oxide reductase MsrA [Flavobacteriaceae bacterium]|nr:peptide-methionine (S)-S-oxide reductase MsrA [Flavobacteriaceae bacterium]MBT3794481.1 peptide-methionine (S)-S-oxide reductase MsrA [Flavobacteriaceae bacterium]
MTSINAIILGGGCFWCAEAIFNRINGVINIAPGYIGGKTKNPTYRDVCTGLTGHAEVIRVEYDSKLISFRDILMIFFSTHDPTTFNRQGNDIGTQYRSSIFTSNTSEMKIINDYIIELNQSKIYLNPIVTNVEKETIFYLAENYHYDYFEQNKNDPYCSVIIAPKVKKLIDSKSSFLK